jgi:MFS family permease
MKRFKAAALIGNVLEHYDQALFGLLAPFIAPLFFSEEDPLTALILTYGILPLSFLTRPLGSLFFGWLGDRFGGSTSLFYSLSGMAFVTVSMGFLPLYKDCGILAPILLALGRMCQGFCMAGETAGGAIFLLEKTEDRRRGLISSFYDASSIGGILIGSILITVMSSRDWIEPYWRFLFWGGGATAFFGLFFRWDRTHESPKKVSWIHALSQNRRSLISIIIASGFSYTAYSLTFTLMNGYVPLVTPLTKSAVMEANTWLLIIDMILLPCSGYLSTLIGKEKTMFIAALLSAITALPLFSLLSQASFITVIVIRMVILLFGVTFAAPYHAWALSQVPKEHRYLILSFGYAIGSQLIGAPSAAISLFLYKITGWVAAPGLYLMLIGSLASLSCKLSCKRAENKVVDGVKTIPIGSS